MLAYDETKDYARISGGNPSIRTYSGCINGGVVNDNGLQIFLRTRERNDSLIEEFHEESKKFEIDLSLLNDFDQIDCSHSKNLAENLVAKNTIFNDQLARIELWLIEEELNGMALYVEQLFSDMFLYNVEILCHTNSIGYPSYMCIKH